MKVHLPHSQRGSMLIIVLGIVWVLSVLAITALSLSVNTYQLSVRNEMRAQARAVAESELDYLLYKFKAVVISQEAITASDAPAALASICDTTTTPTTVRQPFLAAHAAAGWTVKRSMIRENDPFTGTIPGTTKIGTFTYITARVEVIPPATSAFANVKAIQNVRVGRRFINSNTTLFQFSIFFQGDLELNPGSGTTIVKGDVVSNGSIYMGARTETSATLQLTGKVRYLGSGRFNSIDDGTTDGTPTYYNPKAPTPVGVTMGAPVGANGVALNAHSSQVEKMDEPENLLGGVDATAEARSRPELFAPAGASTTDTTLWTDDQLEAAENNVYRSLIVPPPSVDASQYDHADNHTADDNVLSVRRAYSRADLLITVDTAGAVSVSKVVDGVSTDVTAQFGDAVTAPANMYDEREGKQVRMSKLDVGVLKAKLDAARSAPVGNAQHFDFQGLLYVNLKGSSATTPAGIKLTNATSIPFNSTTGAGFSVATNGGLYVQGSYNTSPLTDGTNPVVGADGHNRAVPAMLLADSITVLSSNWVDPTTTLPLSSRVASLSADELSDTTANPLNPHGPKTAVVNAGLLTGNVASNGDSASGGAQNLVRYLEDWSGTNVTFNGSLGRMFTSTTFTGKYAGAASVVYNPPSRTFAFDENIPTHPPPGNPTTTAFGRGDFFTW